MLLGSWTCPVPSPVDVQLRVLVDVAGMKLPYRIRLWRAKRKMDVCSCPADRHAIAPSFHESDCPVYLTWRDNFTRRKQP